MVTTLTRVQYKILAKYLTLRISKAIDCVVNSEQSVLMKDMQILDGSLMIKEFVEWFKKKKKR